MLGKDPEGGQLSRAPLGGGLPGSRADHADPALSRGGRVRACVCVHMYACMRVCVRVPQWARQVGPGTSRHPPPPPGVPGTAGPFSGRSLNSRPELRLQSASFHQLDPELRQVPGKFPREPGWRRCKLSHANHLGAMQTAAAGGTSAVWPCSNPPLPDLDPSPLLPPDNSSCFCSRTRPPWVAAPAG